MTGTTYKTTAVALQGRRLVTVSKKGGRWKAEATEAGLYFVEHGSYPAGHWSATPTTSTSSGPPAPMPVQPRSQTARPARKRRVSGARPVDQLIADVTAAGGRLEVASDGSYYENLVSSAIRHNKVPDGKLLQVTRGRRWEQRTIELVDKPAWMTAVLDPIPVPERLIKPHPAVVVLRADTEHRLQFKRDVRQRALRLLDAAAKSASSRGWSVSCPAWSRYERDRLADLVITVTGHEHQLHVSEDHDKVPHEPTAKELRDFERWGYPRIPKYNKVSSGRLTISVSGGVAVRQSGFSDTKTLDLVDRLPFILQELELRAAASEERRLAAERAAEERRRQWEQVRDEAITALREHTRAEVLADQARRWQHNRLIADYLAAMERRVSELEGDEQHAAQEWLDWAKTHHRRSNPLTRRLAMPPDPKPEPSALQPFMRGLSPYGPESGPWR